MESAGAGGSERSMDVYPARRWRVERRPDSVRINLLRHRPVDEWVGSILTGVFVVIGGLLLGLSPGETSEDREVLRMAGWGALAIGLAGMASIEIKVRKSWSLHVSGEHLSATARGVFGSTTRTWNTSDVESVQANRVFYQGEGSTGTTALVATLKDGRSVELLRYFDTGGNLAMVAGIVSKAVEERRGLSLGMTLQAPGAQCPVCSNPMNAPVLYCGACRTPHHKDCWAYNGQCAIYGCRGIKSSPELPI